MQIFRDLLFIFFWSVIMLQRWRIPNYFQETHFKWPSKKLFSPRSKCSDLCPFRPCDFFFSLILEHFATIPEPSLDHCQDVFMTIKKRFCPLLPMWTLTFWPHSSSYNWTINITQFFIPWMKYYTSSLECTLFFIILISIIPPNWRVQIH